MVNVHWRGTKCFSDIFSALQIKKIQVHYSLHAKKPTIQMAIIKNLFDFILTMK